MSEVRDAEAVAASGSSEPSEQLRQTDQKSHPPEPESARGSAPQSSTQEHIHTTTKGESHSKDNYGSGSQQPSTLSLPLLFRKCESRLEGLDSLAGDAHSKACKAVAGDLEQCAKHVHRLALFSRNEEVDDISTSYLKYLLIPYHLAKLYPRVYVPQQQQQSVARLARLRLSLAHSTAFMESMFAFNIMNKSQAKRWSDHMKDSGGNGNPNRGMSREERIDAYKREQQLKRLVEHLRRRCADDGADQEGDEQVDVEEEVRSMYLAKMELAISEMFTDMSLCEREIEMLQFRAKMEGSAGSTGSSDPRMRQIAHQPKTQATGLDITRISANMEVTREKLRDGVFKPFHNLPTMALAEFAELEVANAMERQERQKAGEQKRVKNYEELVEAGEEDNEELVDAATYRDRAWDNWKDDNPRGSGITKKY